METNRGSRGHAPGRRAFLLRLGSGLGACFLGCRRPSGRRVVGFSQMDSGGTWRVAETASMRQAAAAAGWSDLIVTDAQDQTAKQLNDVEDLVARRVAAVFIAPREYSGLETAFDAARRGNVPVVLIDREAEGTPGIDYVSFIGSDFVSQGKRAADFLAARVAGDAGVVELTGTPGSSVARDRGLGFRRGLAGHQGVTLVASQTAEFSRGVAHAVTTNVLQALGSRVTALFAHSDEMVLGAIQAAKEAGRTPGTDLTFVSVDGQREALEAILRGDLAGTVESNPRFGPTAFALLDRHLAGEPVAAKVIIQDRLFDADNAGHYLAQAY